MRRYFLIYIVLAFFILSGSYALAAQPGGIGVILGYWENIDPYTRGLVAVEFTMIGDQLMIHAWGACHPDPCDWGEAPVILYSTGVSDPQARCGTADYDHGFSYARLGIKYDIVDDMITVFTYDEMKDARYNFRMKDQFMRE